ncbi:cyclophilin-like fold protein [Klebsiella grimontii]|uniref:cyclophilin-like fold protein n=1 Tax=Klebsiella grimontii TaxID=2058152 RepID=UPI001CCB6971|nr:cyclophilin-like fold protein [Klebsiella grimontii]MBZ7673095.1 cyclophilin [Klebsiella grimontii]
MFNSLSATLLIFIVTTGAVSAAERENAVKIQFEFNGATVIGSLDESAAANEFLAQLPMTVKLEDYGSTEKIAWLPTKLRRADSGASMTPRRGDIAYYAPWGNLAIFREDFRHSPGLIKLGRVVEGLKSLDQPGAATVTVSRYVESAQRVK